MEYVLVLNVPFFRVSEKEFACESAFAGHLRVLQHYLPPQFDSVRVCGPSMSEADYQRNMDHLCHIQEHQERIFLTALYPNSIRYFGFLKSYALSTFKTLWHTVSKADLVHAGPSMNLFQPIGIFSLIAAKLKKRQSIAVLDIDERRDVGRSYQLGMISRGRYVLESFFFEPLRRLQLGWVVSNCSLVLFKGQALVVDYGKGKDSVKNFFDTSHSSNHVIPEDIFAKKLVRNSNNQEPIRCVYFGRLVARKGIDYCIRSVVHAKTKLGINICFTVVGDGPERDQLATLIRSLKAEDYISLEPPIQFGADLFDTLYQFDILLAAPLTEDTPRSAFDGMAAGMAICAYDTDYYITLSHFGSMVQVSPWLNIEAMADRIAYFAKNPAILANAQAASRAFALENTQEIWLEKRLMWTKQYCCTPN